MERAEITTKQVILEAQEAFAVLADELGLKTEDDVVNLCRKVRKAAFASNEEVSAASSYVLAKHMEAYKKLAKYDSN
jgi:hypothetical protein